MHSDANTLNRRRVFAIPVTHLLTQIAASHRPLVGLQFRQTSFGDRSLDHHIAVRKGLLLDTKAEASRSFDELGLLRCRSGEYDDLTTRLVGVPDRHSEWPSTRFFNPKDPNVRPREKALTLFN